MIEKELNNNRNTIKEYFLKEEIICDFKVTRRRKALWYLQLEMLQLVDAICKKYAIKYYAIGGTLLGAVRHKGFIPWDDDIDIAMFRSDYEHFIKNAGKEINYPFFLQSPDTEEDYALSHIKIRNTETTGATLYDFEFKYNKGVFIDIFPIDSIPDNSDDKIQLIRGVYDYRRLLDIGARHFWYWQGPDKGKVILSDEEKKVLIDLVKEKTISVICKEFDDHCSKYNNIKTKHCGILALELTSERFFWEKSWFGDQIYFPFEFLKIPCPHDYDKVLRKTYGDYSSFKRDGALHGHLIFESDISYKDYILTDNPSFL